MPLVAQFQYFLFQQLGVHGVEARERLVEDKQGRAVEHGDDKLHLLLHAFREFLELLVPPRHDAERFKPHFKAALSLGVGEAFELREVNGLLAYLHLFVQPALLGQVADAPHVVGAECVPVKRDFAAIGGGDAVDDAYERGLARAVGPEQAEHLAARHADAHVVERGVLRVAFHDVRSRKEIILCRHYRLYVYVVRLNKNN